MYNTDAREREMFHHSLLYVNLTEGSREYLTLTSIRIFLLFFDVNAQDDSL